MIILISMVLLVGFGQFSGVDYQRPDALVYSFVVLLQDFVVSVVGSVAYIQLQGLNIGSSLHPY